jgi:hypothetical protein
MLVFPYKTQVHIFMTSMALHNYIRRKSEHEAAFTEFDCHPKFVLRGILTDVVPHSQKHGN